MDDDFNKIHMLSEMEDSGKISIDGNAIFIVAVCVCVGICSLALLMGISIPGAVIVLFARIILTVGFFVMLGKIFG